MSNTIRKRVISRLITLTILGIGVFVFYYLSSQKESTVSAKYSKKERPKVKLASFPIESASNEIAIDGRAIAAERVGIFSKVNGILEAGSTRVREGAYFKKGELLFRVDDEEARFNLLAQKSNLMTSITQMMPDLKFDYPDGFGKWQNYLDQFDVQKPLPSLPEITDKQEKYYVTAKSIFNQYYAIKSLEARLADYNIYAPFSGVLTSVSVYPGALVSPGANLANMINTTSYELLATVPLKDVSYVKVGQKVNLSSPDIKGNFTGTISRIGSQIDNATQNLPLYIRVSGTGLKDNMYLSGSIKGQDIEEVSQLPKSIFVNPQTIYIVRDSTILLKEVQSVKRLADSVLVTGLSADEKVIVGSLAGLYEGQKVSY